LARVIAVTGHALNFNTFALPVCHERHSINVVSKNKTPLVDVFSEYVFGFPTEESFGRRRPARHAEVAVPFDNCERRTLNVKFQTSRCFLSLLARTDVADDGYDTGDVVLFVEKR